jgi:hypothetical protein
MKKQFFFTALTLSFLSLTAMAQDKEKIPTVKLEEKPPYTLIVDLKQFCPSPPVETKTEDCLVLSPVERLSFDMAKVLDKDELQRKKACEQLLTMFSDPKNKEKSITVEMLDQDKDKWHIKFFFGYSRAKYLNSDVHVQSTKVNGTFTDFQWKERNSFEYFKLEEIKKPGNTFRFIDEPTNTFGLTLDKGHHVIMFSVFHLKYLKQKFQTTQFEGTINGQQVNGMVTEDKAFDGNYQLDPSQMYLRRFENTYWNINPQIGYGYKLNVLGNEKTGKLSYTPYAQVGFMAGTGFTAYKNDQDYWTTDGYDQKLQIKGASVSAGQRLDYQKGVVSVFIDQKFTAAKIDQPFLDGRAKYNLYFAPVTFGFGVEIPTQKKKKTIEDPLE